MGGVGKEDAEVGSLKTGVCGRKGSGAEWGLGERLSGKSRGRGGDSATGVAQRISESCRLRRRVGGVWEADWRELERGGGDGMRLVKRLFGAVAVEGGLGNRDPFGQADNGPGGRFAGRSRHCAGAGNEMHRWHA